MNRALVYTVVVLSLACATRAPAPVAPPPGPAGSMSDGLHWVRSSAEYQALTRQTYALAAARLEELVRDEKEPWVVSLDGDETIFDNSQHEKERAEKGKAFDPVDWDAWCRRREAGAVPGAVAFAKRVRELGGRIAIVSNRDLSVLADTRANLEALGVPFDVLLLQEKEGRKEGRWRRLTDGSAAPGLPKLKIVLYVGDNIQDFPGLDQSLARQKDESFRLFGDRYFVIPNPVYGSWTRNPKK